MANPRFCSHCGAALNSAAKFCAACGKPIAPQDTTQRPDAPPPAPAAPAETVLGVLPGAVRHSGFLGIKTEAFVIVFTSLRVLFAAQTTEMMKANVLRARDIAKEQGKGFFGQWGAQFGANSGHEYRQRSPQDILAEQPANFFLPISHLRRIHLWEAQSSDEDSVRISYYIEFETGAEKHKFSINDLDIRAWKQQLQQTYGSIVR